MATIFFPIVVILLNLVQASHHNPLRQPASQLALHELGWLMDVAFVSLAVGTLLVAFVLARTLGRFGSPPVVLLMVAGALGFIPAFVSTDPAGVPPTTHGLVHNLNGLLTFVLYVAAMIASAVVFRTSAFWAPFRQTTMAFAIAGTVSFGLLLVLGGLNLFGLGERIAIAIWITWLLLVAWRGRTAANGQPADRVAESSASS